MRHLNYLFHSAFHLIHFRNLSGLFNNLLDYLLGSDNLLHCRDHRDWLLSNHLDLSYLVLNNYSFVRHLHYFCVHNDFFYDLLHLSYLNFWNLDFDYFLNDLGDLLDDLLGFVDWNQLLDDLFNRVPDFHWDHLWPLDFNNMFSFDDVCDYLLNLNLLRYLDYPLHNPLTDDLYG